MSPEKTIRWAAALYALPFVLFLTADLVRVLLGGHPTLLSNYIMTLLVLTPPVCMVAFSSRAAAGISLATWGLLTLFIVVPSVRALLNGNFHLLISQIRIVGMVVYAVATAYLLRRAGSAAQEIQRQKKNPDVASVFE